MSKEVNNEIRNSTHVKFNLTAISSNRDPRTPALVTVPSDRSARTVSGWNWMSEGEKIGKVSGFQNWVLKNVKKEIMSWISRICASMLFNWDSSLICFSIGCNENDSVFRLLSVFIFVSIRELQNKDDITTM